MNKPREFWIAKGITVTGDDYVWVHKPNLNPYWEIRLIHTVEKSAYDTKCAEVEDLQAEILKLKDSTPQDVSADL